MRFSLANFVPALAIAAVAALGGALMVYAGYDDSPGGSLIGLFLVLAAAMVGGWVAARKG